MESMEEVFRYESKARGLKIKKCIEVLSYCRAMINTIKINPNAQEQILQRIDEVLKDD